MGMLNAKSCAAMRQLLFALMPACCLSGCATFSGHPEPVVKESDEIAALAPLFHSDAIVTCIRTPTDECRNIIAFAKMEAIDMRFRQFETRMFRQTREAGFGATLATLGLTTAATIVGGSARAFSATAAVITGGREAFDKELLAQQTLLAIHSAMRAKRSEVAIRIYNGLNLPVASYTVNHLQRDLQSYEAAGNVLSAMVGVNDIVGDVAKKAQDDLQKTIRIRLDPAAVRIKKAICAGNRCEVTDKYKQCAAKSNVQDVFFDDFINSQEFSSKRTAVADCLEQ